MREKKYETFQEALDRLGRDPTLEDVYGEDLNIPELVAELWEAVKEKTEQGWFPLVVVFTKQDNLREIEFVQGPDVDVESLLQGLFVAIRARHKKEGH
jgi:hypothetical protein